MAAADPVCVREAPPKPLEAVPPMPLGAVPNGVDEMGGCPRVLPPGFAKDDPPNGVAADVGWPREPAGFGADEPPNGVAVVADCPGRPPNAEAACPGSPPNADAACPGNPPNADDPPPERSRALVPPRPNPPNAGAGAELAGGAALTGVEAVNGALASLANPPEPDPMERPCAVEPDELAGTDGMVIVPWSMPEVVSGTGFLFSY